MGLTAGAMAYSNRQDYQGFGMEWPPRQAWDNFRQRRRQASGLLGLCYAANPSEQLEFAGLGRVHGKDIIVVHDFNLFRRKAKTSSYEFFILKSSAEQAWEGLAIIANTYRRRNRKVPPISLVESPANPLAADTNVDSGLSRHLLYFLSPRYGLVYGSCEPRQGRILVNAGLEEALLRAYPPAKDAKLAGRGKHRVNQRV